MARNALTVGLGAHFVFGPVGHALDRVAAVGAARRPGAEGVHGEPRGHDPHGQCRGPEHVEDEPKALRVGAAGRRAPAESADIKAALSYLARRGEDLGGEGPRAPTYG